MSEVLVKRKYKPYPKYKDSGVEWLGKVPERWDIKRLKHIGTSVIGLTYSPEEVADNGILVLRSSNIQDGKISLDDNVYVNRKVSRKLITQEGDILICSRNGSRNLIGKSAYIDKKSQGCSFGAFTTVFRSVYNRFIFYVFNSTLFKYQSGSYLTATINQLTIENLNNMRIAFPPIEEQTQIAKFLDKETSKIDTLIEKKQRLIVLLEEKRQAIISHAVTKGLDPNVKMKDSGIEWLGEVPEHWEVTSLGNVSVVIDPQPDHRAPAIAESEGFPYVGIRDLNPDGTVNVETARMVEESAVIKQEKSFTIEEGDIVFCKVGTIGYPRHIKAHTRIALSATLVLIKCKSNCDSNYLRYALDGNNIYTQIRLLSTGSTRETLGIQLIRKLKLCLPELKEQKKIGDFLKQYTDKVDTLINKLSIQITKLQEYRQALISAAVTGKIDVR